MKRRDADAITVFMRSGSLLFDSRAARLNLAMETRALVR